MISACTFNQQRSENKDGLGRPGGSRQRIIAPRLLDHVDTSPPVLGYKTGGPGAAFGLQPLEVINMLFP